MVLGIQVQTFWNLIPLTSWYGSLSMEDTLKGLSICKYFMTLCAQRCTNNGSCTLWRKAVAMITFLIFFFTHSCIQAKCRVFIYEGVGLGFGFHWDQEGERG